MTGSTNVETPSETVAFYDLRDILIVSQSRAKLTKRESKIRPEGAQVPRIRSSTFGNLGRTFNVCSKLMPSSNQTSRAFLT